MQSHVQPASTLQSTLQDLLDLIASTAWTAEAQELMKPVRTHSQLTASLCPLRFGPEPSASHQHKSDQHQGGGIFSEYQRKLATHPTHLPCQGNLFSDQERLPILGSSSSAFVLKNSFHNEESHCATRATQALDRY